MTWSYDADPAGDRKDEVRLMVGDTDPADPMVADEEITYILGQWTPPEGKPAWMAAAHVCDAIAAKFARQVQSSVGSLSQSAQQMYEHYLQEAQKYRTLFATNGRGIIAGAAGTGFLGIKAGAPILSGGGKTYLGAETYMNPEGN